MHYLDNASTTRPSPEVVKAVEEVLLSNWANPSSLYRAGLKAERQMEDARAVLAKAVGCGTKEVFFTASGTEANNIAIFGAVRARSSWANHIVTTGYEHPSVRLVLRALEKREGFELTEVAPEADGRIDIAKLVAAVGKKTAIVCAMQVNNETGAVLDVATLAAAVKAKNPRTFVHVDGVQAFCKQSFNYVATKVDSYSISGHKIHAPKGVGALVLRAGSNIVPLIAGGGQEADIRPGTENLAYIVGLAKAVQYAQENKARNTEIIEQLHDALMQGLSGIQGAVVHSPKDAYKGVVAFSMPKGLRSQVVLNHLDVEHNVCVSSGSACSGAAASYTLTAMGLTAAAVESALRVSFCANNTQQDVQALLAGLADCVQKLARS